MRQITSLIVLSIVFAGLPAHAAPIWPTSWIDLALSDNSGNGDFSGASGVSQLDLVGNPVLRYAVNASDIFFSMRVVSLPSLGSGAGTTNGVWQVLFDNDANADIDWTLQLDQVSNDVVELTHATNSTSKILVANGVEFSATSTWSGAITPDGYARTQSTAGNEYLELAMPLSTFVDNVGTSFRVSVSTSTQHNNINKDIIGSENSPGFDNVANIWSEPVSVPEPSTLILTALGACGLVLKRWRRAPIT